MISNRVSKGLLALTAAAVALPAMAADDRVSSTRGFHGNVLLGAGYVDLESNLVAGNDLIDAKSKTIQSVNQSPDSNDAAFPVVSGEVNYSFGNGWEAFFGGNIEDYVTMDFATRLGVRKDWDGVGVTGLSAVFSGLPADVYEDPYLVGVPRSTTERDSTGVRFDWWRILDSNFFFQFQTRKIDVDTERSGTDPALGLTASEISLLRRDGDDSRYTLGYRWQNGDHLFQPEISFGEDDRDGDAVGGDVAGGKLTYSYFATDWTLVASGSFRSKDYDAANPVYDKKTDSDEYAVALSGFYKVGWGDGNWQLFGSMAYGDSDSDVDFHDASVFSASLGVAYFFGKR